MSFYDGDNSGDEMPPPPRTGQLKRGATLSDPQPNQQSMGSGNSTQVSGFGPYRRISVQSEIDIGLGLGVKGAATSGAAGTSVGASTGHNSSRGDRDGHHPLLRPAESEQAQQQGEDEWQFTLPDSWSCQEKNSAGIVGDEFGLRLDTPGGSSKRKPSSSSSTFTSSRTSLVKKDVALVVTNKPIPIMSLAQQAERSRNELRAAGFRSAGAGAGGGGAMDTGSAAKIAGAATAAVAGTANAKASAMTARMPSFSQSNEHGSMFPKFVKPSRHERRDSGDLTATDDDKIADFSSLVGMVAPKGGGGNKNIKTANEIYDGLVKSDSGGRVGEGGTKDGVGGSDNSEGTKAGAATEPELPSFVYYFEVTIVTGEAWVGMVPAESVVTHEQAQLMMSDAASRDGSDYDGGLLLGAATKPNPFPILMHQIPGKSPQSIGLGNNGELHMGGSKVGRDGQIVPSFPSHYGSRMKVEEPLPWTEPFNNIEREEHHDSLLGMGEGETIGCGWEIGGSRQVFFTRNGKVLHSEKPIDGFDARGGTMFPAVGMQTEGTTVVANFGLEPTNPLQFRGDSRFIPINASPSAAAAHLEIETHQDKGKLHEPAKLGPISNEPLPISHAKPTFGTALAAKVTSDFGDDRPRSARVGAHHVGPGDEDSQLEAVLKKSMQETSARKPAVEGEAKPSLSKEDIEETRATARDLRNIAENPHGADPELFHDLLKLCRSKQQQVVSNLQSESVSADFESLIDLNGILLFSIEAAEGVEETIKASHKPTRKSIPHIAPHSAFESSIADDTSRHDDQDDEIQKDTKQQTLRPTSPVRDGEMPRSSPEVEELVQARDFFSLLCLLRGHHNQRLASAYALLRFAKDETIGGDENSTDIRKEIQTSGGMHSLLTLFRSSSDGQEIKMVAALAVAYLLPCYTDPDGLLVRNLGLRVITCLRYVVSSCDDVYIEGLEPPTMRQSAALALTHIWLSLEPLLGDKGSYEQQDHEESKSVGALSIVSERLPRAQRHRIRGPLAKSFALRTAGDRLHSLDPRRDLTEVQKLLEQSVSLIVTLAEKLIPSANSTDDSLGASASSFSVILAVESVCSVEPARSVAVREGLLGVLVQWLNSGHNDLVFPAAKSIRFLTTLDDSYMAGWIHSQIVNENALPAIVKLTTSDQADVRLAVAEILASLSIAPHTRAAVIDNNGLDYLVQLLANYSTSDRAWDGQSPTTLAVGNALLQLASGAMANSNKWRRSSDPGHDYSERAGILDALIDGGAIEPLIAMAKAALPSKLRLMSVDFLCIISADARPRKYLCRSGAAEAFGLVLNQDTPKLYKIVKRKRAKDLHEICDSMGDALEELYSALLALANLLEASSSHPRSKRSRSSLSDITANSESMEVLRQTAKSGGLEALLILTSLPLPSATYEYSADVTSFDIRELSLESSRSLASLCPLLLSERASTFGLTHWAGDVLLALTNVLRRRAGTGELEIERLREQQLDALRGLAYLARYEPLKIRLVDGLISQLLQMKSSRSNDTETSKAANQVCASLGFRDDDIDLQCIGNDPKLAADWFCLERCLLLQAMARSQIRKVLYSTWKDSIQEIAATMVNVASGGMDRIHESDSDYSLNSSVNEIEEIKMLKEVVFQDLSDDHDSVDIRRKTIAQYHEIYGNAHANEAKGHARLEMKSLSSETSSAPFDDDALDHSQKAMSSLSVTEDGAQRDKRTSLTSHLRRMSQTSQMSEDSSSHETRTSNESLLAASPCSIIGSTVEREWVLTHQSSFDEDQLQIGGFDALPERVQSLVQTILPSKMLQSAVIPLAEYMPSSSFDFRALAMPERSYYSFRREGQVVARVCEKHASMNENEDAFWTLSFTNSTFAGEYAESLVQALYRCPIIQAISFSKKGPETPLPVGLRNQDPSGSTTLADLAGSLPPWVTCLTFDNVLSDVSFSQLVSALKAMGQLDLTDNNSLDHSVIPQQSSVAGAAFEFLAICNSPGLRRENFVSFFELIGSQLHPSGGGLGFRHPSLQSLVALDLSGNLLGDDSVAALLSIIYNKDSLCSLERLDVSQNAIGRGDSTRQVLEKYVADHSRSSSDPWRASLSWLSLASNNLNQGRLALDILEMMIDDGLGLSVIDLSNNDLSECDGEELLQVLLRVMESGRKLSSLDLSSNGLSNSSIDDFIEGAKSLEGSHRLAYLGLKNNEPPLNRIQIYGIKELLSQGKIQRVMDFNVEKNQTNMKLLAQEQSSGADESGSVSNAPAVVSAAEPNSLGGPLQPSDISPPSTHLSENNSVTQSSVVGEGSISKNAPIEVGRSDTILRDHQSLGLDMSSPSATIISSLNAAAEALAALANKITVLFSAPLVYKDVYGRLCPIDTLDFELERELLWQVFKEASRDIDLSFDCATMNRLQANMTVGCTCLHFSGHGHPSHLTFEDGKGGMQWLAVGILRELISRNAQDESAPFQFVFVSACHSLLAGETFVRAGVPHVVCCQQESQLMDSAALAFTRAFYLALAIGRTVKDSFEIGRQAVACSPSVPLPDVEMKKFVLLPENGDHDYPVFDANPLPEWPKPSSDSQQQMFGSVGVPRRSLLRKSMAKKGSSRQADGGGGSSSLASDHHLPTPPQGFLGREVEMYLLLNAVLDKRLVNLVGPTGMGRSSLAAALCHYVHDRKADMRIDNIFYVRARQTRRSQPLSAILSPLHKQLVAAGMVVPQPTAYDMDEVANSILKALHSDRSLIVLDRIEVMEGSEDAAELPLFLNNLFRQTRYARVLLTANASLNLSSFGGVGEHIEELGPLNLKNTVKLFGILCRHVCTAGERKNLLEAIVNQEEEDMCVSDASLSSRSRDVFARLGDGIPARVFDAAYQITAEEYQSMLEKGR